MTPKKSCMSPLGAAPVHQRVRVDEGEVLALLLGEPRRFVEEGLEAALSEEPRPVADGKLAAKEEALLVATACLVPPAGRARWTLALLADAIRRGRPLWCG